MASVKNPVLPGFHPDPSILRVGEWYFIANSTFEWFPGVELHRSRDLANWETLPSPLQRISQLDMEGNPPSGGIWAPCLSYADGLFWLIYTDVKHWAPKPFKDANNYLVTAPTSEGPWSEPVFLNATGFDPSLFHDSDGRKWLVNMEWDYRREDTKNFSGILLQEYDPQQKKLVGPIHKIFIGSSIGKTEGPHLYKRNGWYYLVTAEGGTEYEHAVTVARSRSILGPYEIHPSNPLVTSSGRKNLYLQKAGHGSWCDTPDGRTYLAFLVGRPLPGTNRCILGRETALAEVVWKDNWPWLKEGGNSAPDSFDALENKKPIPQTVTYAFSDNHFLLDFKTLRVPFAEPMFSISERAGFLRIRGEESLQSRHRQAVIVRRQEDFSFQAETAVEFEPKSFHQMAGLLYRYDELSQFYLRISHDKELGKCLGLLVFEQGKFRMPLGEQEIPLPPGRVYLRVETHFKECQFSYSLEGSTWHTIGPVLDASVLSDDAATPLGFTGAMVGMACQDAIQRSAYADFAYFTYTRLDKK
jgi:xylan 1,4-beta-xylosidase